MQHYETIVFWKPLGISLHLEISHFEIAVIVESYITLETQGNDRGVSFVADMVEIATAGIANFY